jgi:DNA-directed RNA polymerase I and III subunit RPAC1
MVFFCLIFSPISDQQVLDDQGNVKDTLEFELKIRCKRNPNPPENSKNPNELYIDNNCYTKHIKWIPKPGQKELFKSTFLLPI